MENNKMSSQALARGRMKSVKNLGWLIRHWREVKTFKVSKNPDQAWDAFLEAFNCNGILIYQTGFSSNSILWGWLSRPVFRGVPVDWFGIKTSCGDKEIGGLLKIIWEVDSDPSEWLSAVQSLQDVKKVVRNKKTGTKVKQTC